MKIFDSELKIMHVLWQNGETTAKRIAEILAEQIGWSKTTTYTVLKKCIKKKAVSRREPNFFCQALVSKEQAQEEETNSLINKMYGGMSDQLVAAILGSKKLSPEEIKKLKTIVRKLS